MNICITGTIEDGVLLNRFSINAPEPTMAENSVMLTPAIENIWRELEGQAAGPEADVLLERKLKAGLYAELYLGLIPATAERTLQLRVSREAAAAFASSSHSQNLWIRSFIFQEGAQVAMVLTDDALRGAFTQLASDIVNELHLRKSGAEESGIAALAELPARWLSLHGHTYAVAA